MKRYSVVVVLGIIGLLLAVYVVPWRNVHWGQFQLASPSVITVTGQAQTQQKNTIAHFNAGVSAANDSKEVAVTEVNQKANELMQAVKEFGIPDADIKTQNASVYQVEDMVMEGGRQRSRPGQWRANNDIAITLRDPSRAQALTDLLTSTKATNVSGPNYTVDDAQTPEIDLANRAVQNAREKADALAKASGRSLGKVVSVTEGMSSAGIPMPYDMAVGKGGGGAPIEPGTQTVSKTVTVTFELK